MRITPLGRYPTSMRSGSPGRVYSEAAILFLSRSHTPACSNSQRIRAWIAARPLSRGVRSRGGGST